MGVPAPAPPRDKAVAFSQPEQVAEILREANRLRLQVLIKTSSAGKAIRGQLEYFDAAGKSMRIGSISPAGDALLRGHDFVKVEFILLSKKLVFVSPIRGRTNGKLMLGLPDKLVAIERRVNARFRVPQPNAAFLEFPDRRVDLTRFDAPFVPDFLLEDRSPIARLRIDDVSLGGVACFTRYPSVAELLKTEEDGVQALLYFPNTPPLQVPVSVRWTKKTTAPLQGKFEIFSRIIQQKLKPLVGTEDIEIRENFFRVGLQFSEVSKDLDAAIRSFIKLVQAAESV